MSPARLFTAILFVALFTMSVREISDPDFWWHLRTGQYIVETGTIPHTDPFAFTAQGKEWVTHEWLSEVIIYALYRVGELALLTLVFAGIITLALGLVYWRSVGRPYLAGFALLLGALATAPTWGVRPQMISLLLMSVFLVLLDFYGAKDDWRFLVPLPILTALWVNLHSGYALGLVVIGGYLIAGVAYRISRITNRKLLIASDASPVSDLQSSYLAPLVITFALSFAAVLMNPNGARMYSYPFETLTSPAMQRYIQEWFSPDFHQVEWLPFALLILATLATALIARAPVSLADILLLFVFGLAALRSARNVPLFAIVAVPVLAAQLAALIPLRATSNVVAVRMRWVNVVVLVGVVAVAMARIGSVLGNQAVVERQKFPEAAVDWIEANRPAPNLYNSYDWGGYLIWRLYPDYKVYIDGRADVHGDAFIEQFLNIYRGEPGWEDELGKRDVRVVLIEPSAPLAGVLGRSANWVQAFADAQSVVYEKK
ncbi:MAG TPA: hypothetical protein VFD70_00045 [Anaerolineae bacterium]|nr:hypothetical protein [Anaerolineae bacterium]